MIELRKVSYAVFFISTIYLSRFFFSGIQRETLFFLIMPINYQDLKVRKYGNYVVCRNVIRFKTKEKLK